MSSLIISDIKLYIKNTQMKTHNSALHIEYCYPSSQETGKFYFNDQIKDKHMLWV